MFTRGFLRDLRLKAIRKKVLYSSLDSLERGILYLSSRIVEQVHNPTLALELVKIVRKLEENMESGFNRYVQRFGPRRVVDTVLQAVKFGCLEAKNWVLDKGYQRYLAFLDYNQVYGYRVT